MVTLSQETFKIGIETLSTYYSSFKFWEEDFKGQVELRKSLWYNVFKNYDDETFIKLIEQYCLSNIYAPQSPTHLLQFFNDKTFEKHQGKIEEAWSLIISLIKRHGMGNKTIYNHEINDFVTYNPIEKHLQDHADKNIYESYKMVKSRLTNLNDSNEPFVRKEFVEIYESLLKRQIQETVIKGNVSLTNKDTLKLGEKK